MLFSLLLSLHAFPLLLMNVRNVSPVSAADENWEQVSVT